jgi:hypothetical protein
VTILEDIVGFQSTHVVPTLWTTPDGTLVAFNADDEAISVDGAAVPPTSAMPLPK